MEPIKDYNVVFTTANGTETVATEWVKRESNGFAFYSTNVAGLNVSVLEKDNELYLRSGNPNKEPVTGFIGIRFGWEAPTGGYTVIPGIYYDGNYHNIIKDIPYMHLPESPVFQASMSAASVPAVFAWDGKGTAYHYAVSHTSAAGWNGVELDGERKYITFYAPAREERHYHWLGYSGPRAPHIWNQWDLLSFRVSRTAFGAESVNDVFAYVWDKGRRLANYPAGNTPRMPAEQAEKLVRDWVYDKHCVVDKDGVPLILNAFNDIDHICPDELPAEWNIMIGWCSGTMTALPLLKAGGKYREYAVRYIDFLSQNGNTVSGIKSPVYGKGKWMAPDHPDYQNSYKHCRFYADYIYYLGKAIAFEAENGHTHESWEKDFRHGLDMLVKVWEKNRDFGLHWDIYGNEVVIDIKGTGAGAFALLALAEGVKHYPQDRKLKDILLEAADVYYRRCVLSGHSNGGPADIMEADDSESIAALTDALVQLYYLTGNEIHREMAVKAGHLFASWVLCYRPEFPGGTALEGLNVCGGVLANVQNRHVGPGICTNSARFTHELAKITGDDRWEALYEQINAAAMNCVPAYTGEFWGWDFSQPFAAGMVTEQINVTDAIGRPGDPGYVSASWPATAVLLGYWDR